MTQKVLKVGSSATVTIPKKSLEELGIQIGDKIFLRVDTINKRIIISKKKLETIVVLSKEDIKSAKLTKEFIKRYRQDLEALAKK